MTDSAHHAYEYRITTLLPGQENWRRFSDEVFGLGKAAIADHGGRLVGLFRPQLGFSNNDAVTLTEWRREGVGWRQGHHLVDGAKTLIDTAHVEFMVPTIRPGPEPLTLAEGGIYVHRWFTVPETAVDEFVALSAEAWKSFEERFEAQIFGLFEAEALPEDDADEVRRLLLLTRYADHGEWEASRSVSAEPEAWSHFLRRGELTLSSVARSSLLVPA